MSTLVGAAWFSLWGSDPMWFDLLLSALVLAAGFILACLFIWIAVVTWYATFFFLLFLMHCYVYHGHKWWWVRKDLMIPRRLEPSFQAMERVWHVYVGKE